ncbi:VOC family protein [Arthrobacter globiformis]|uniref:VOC family protein n=1 Tax=Arthrobacter globiformis TaxID=1665 RepID=UPI00397C4C3B
MNGVRTLGYLGITSDRLDDWRELAGSLLGAQVTEQGHGLDIRLDQRTSRVQIMSGEHNDLAFAGWEVADDAEIEALADRLKAQGYKFDEASPSDAGHRQVQRMFTGEDPDGNRVELFHSAAVAGEPFVSPHQVKFETHPGVGHMVLYCSDLPAMLEFYCSGLGLRVTDSIHLSSEVIYFLRCNERHHSLALVAGKNQYTLQHIMFEVTDIDEVGAAYERCSDKELAQTTLGRHSNDNMYSFYALAPGGFTIEYGCGGRLIDDATHRGASYTTTSWWGHRDLKPSR